MRKLIWFFFLLIPIATFAQEGSKFGIQFHGFVKNDIFYDSRQTVTARDGHFLLYPTGEYFDENGADINAAPQFNILSIQTRLKGVISGPDALGAKTSGLIEGAFFGNIGTDINGFRLRHAFIKLSWEHAEFLAGQYWHPMFVTSNFPGTVSFNTGTPFQPFSRNPQLRFTYKAGNINLIAAAMEQVDFKDGGPSGASTQYIRNAVMPELNLRLEYKTNKLLFGLGANYKTLQPRNLIENSDMLIEYDGDEYTVAGSSIKATDKVQGTSFFAYGNFTAKKFIAKLYAIQGQMLYGMTNLGGYAESNVVYEQFNYDLGDGTLIPLQKIVQIEYTPVKTNSYWADLVYKMSGDVSFGIFGGLSQNKGAIDEITGANYSRGTNIAYLYRISPRMIYNADKFRIAPEIEYTVAAYGNPDEMGIVDDATEVANLRFLLGLYYFF